MFELVGLPHPHLQTMNQGKMAGPIIEQLRVPKTCKPMILVLGQTGAGKSHFINKVVGSKVAKESARLYSCTTKPELVEAKVDDNEFLRLVLKTMLSLQDTD